MISAMFVGTVLVTLIAHTAPALAAVVAVIAVVLVRWASSRVRLRIGTDGIVARDLFGSRFVSHAEITDVSAEGSRVRIARANGNDIQLEVPVPKAEREHPPAVIDEAVAIVRRLRQAQSAHREGSPATDLSAALDRGARTTREWLADLRKLGEGTVATFRTVGIARDEILDVVTSTTATAKDRIAALIALRPTLREDEKTRVRVATERIAAPELREQMVRVLDEDDELALTEALEAVDGK